MSRLSVAASRAWLARIRAARRSSTVARSAGRVALQAGAAEAATATAASTSSGPQAATRASSAPVEGSRSARVSAVSVQRPPIRAPAGWPASRGLIVATRRRYSPSQIESTVDRLHLEGPADHRPSVARRPRLRGDPRGDRLGSAARRRAPGGGAAGPRPRDQPRPRAGGAAATVGRGPGGHPAAPQRRRARADRRRDPGHRRLPHRDRDHGRAPGRAPAARRRSRCTRWWPS